MNKKRICFLLLLFCLSLLLCGCRTRITGVEAGSVPSGAASGSAEETQHGESVSEHSASISAQEEASNGEDGGEPGKQTRENPDAARKEYDENAPAEVVPGTDRLLHGEGEGSGQSAANMEAEAAANQLNGQAEETATQTVAAREAEQMGVNEEAAAAESALTYFTVLLQDRMGSLYECQRLNAYWETEQDHLTIHKTSPEHDLILTAGLYDVSARLLPENLRVDDGWIVRKNPGVIIKIVDGGVLGGAVHSAGAAEAACQRLLRREGWAAIDAVKNNRIILLSRELLETPCLQTAAMVMIAKTANPDLFRDVDLDEALQMLTQEATGALPTGIYYYRKEE